MHMRKNDTHLFFLFFLNIFNFSFSLIPTRRTAVSLVGILRYLVFKIFYLLEYYFEKE